MGNHPLGNHPPIITAKLLLPTRSPDLLRRSRLVDFLHANIDRKLIVVAAPAGYGKTSLLVDFLHEVDAAVCWYSLDPYDADPRVFLDHLIASIQMKFPNFGHRTQAALKSMSNIRDNLYPLTAVLANEIYEISDYLVLVLDDFHHVDSSEVINGLLSLLLRYAKENFHLIISSRTLPGIPDQALMFARGQMAGLGLEDLKFTPDEVQALVKQNYGLDLPAHVAEDLARYSDGWITGILLAGYQAGWENILAGAVRLSEASGRVYDYLAEQVLDRQPPALREFLLESSVLSEMTPARCDLLLGRNDSHMWLEYLGRNSLFVTSVGEDVYAYHPLFREFLLSRLRALAPERYRELLLRMAEEHKSREEWERAISIYMSLGLYEEAAALIETAGRTLFDTGRWDTLISWLDALPRSLFYSQPWLMKLRGRIHAERGEPDEAVEYCYRAAEMYRERADRVQEAYAHLVMTQALYVGGHYRKALEEAQAMEQLLLHIADEQERKKLLGGLRDCQGASCYLLGDLKQAITYLREAAEILEESGEVLGAANAHHNVGISFRALGRIEEALRHYRAALQHWQTLGHPGGMANTLNSLGVIYYLRGEWEEAERAFMAALERAKEGGVVRLEATILASLGDLYRDKQQFTVAMQYYQEAKKLARETHHDFMLAYILQAESDTFRRQNNLKEASAILEMAFAQAEKVRSPFALGLCYMVQGNLYVREGKLEAAREAYREALDTLEKVMVKHDVAKATLYLAHVHFLLGSHQLASQYLRRLESLLQSLGYDHFVAVEGKFMRDMLTWAAQQGFSRIARAYSKVDYVSVAESARPSTIRVELPSQQPPLTIHALGRPRIVRGERELLSQHGVLKELFFYLLSKYPNPVRKDEVINYLWPGFTVERADGTLRVALYRLRRSVCPVITEGGWLSLQLPEHSWYDVHVFDSWLQEAREARTRVQELDFYRRALALYKGDYLESWDAPWVVIERERLRREYIGALLALGNINVELGDYTAAINYFRRVTEEEPYQEEAWRGLLKAYALNGNRAAAIESFHQLRLLLRDELGLDPAPETQVLYRRILDLEL